MTGALSMASKRTASPGGVSGEAAERGQSGVGSGQGMVPVLTCQSKRWATLAHLSWPDPRPARVNGL